MKIWPKQFHTKQCSAISSPFTSVLFAIFLAFSTGGKFLRPSQTPGGDICIVLKKHFGTSGWCWRWGSQVLGTSRLPLHCSPWSDRLIGTHVSRWLYYCVYLCFLFVLYLFLIARWSCLLRFMCLVLYQSSHQIKLLGILFRWSLLSFAVSVICKDLWLFICLHGTSFKFHVHIRYNWNLLNLMT